MFTISVLLVINFTAAFVDLHLCLIQCYENFRGKHVDSEIENLQLSVNNTAFFLIILNYKMGIRSQLKDY